MTAPQPPQQSVAPSLDTINREPNDLEVNELVKLFNQGRYREGEILARELTIRLPRHGFGWKVLGALLKLQGANKEALTAMRKAAEFSPDDEEVQNNLGALLGEMNNWLEAEAACRRALAINANFADAHFNLGNAYQAQGRFAEAEASFMRTLELKPHYATALFNLSMLLKEQGRLVEAESSYRKLLEIRPDYAEAHNNLGVLLYEQGRLREAEASYRYALVAKHDYVGAHNNLGNCLKNQGRFAEAETSYQTALVIKPDQAEVLNHLGIICKETGRVADAVASYRRAIAVKPDYAAAYNNLGIALGEQNCFSEAEASYRRALEISSDLPEVFFNLGKLLQQQGRYAEAEANYLRALAIKLDYADAHNNLGNTLREQNRLIESEASYRCALQVKPDYAEAHNNLGITLHARERFSEAEASYLRALEIRPDFSEAFCNLGNTHKEQGRFADAEMDFRRALELKPDYAEAYYNKGNLFKDLGRFAQAEASYRQALAIKPDFTDARSNLLFTLNYSASHAPSYCLDEARQYGRILERRTGKRFSNWLCPPQPERLRVGIVSADLRNHPVGYFLEGLLRHIDPSRVELIAYPSQRKEDELTARIRSCFSAWKPIGHNDAVAADEIHADGVHVLLDLSGHTAENRLPLFALRPAPVQASWLGYFATTGVVEMNYLLGDPYVTPPEEENHFSETVWRLPESYLCFTPPDAALDVGPLPALSAGSITFGCFNNLTKMSDDVVVLWARVLQAVPGSRLFLKTKQLNDLSVRETTWQRFAIHGIAADRLILEGSSPRVDLLKAYQRVDIALDPFPYPGGTTSVEGLWMGVPAITLKGDRFLSHVGESIAHNAGLADWIAADDDAYVAKAVEHASNPERLAFLRAGLRQQVLASPLFDAARFARHFEEALWGMWQQRQGYQGDVTVIPPQEQLLHEAVKHHQAGRLQDAERLYRAILQTHPQHPDANHNLGLLAVQVQQPIASLPHFEAALAANPQAQQYWLSYIDVLIQVGRLDQARQVLALGRQHGLSEAVSDALLTRMAAMQTDQPAPEVKSAAQSKPAKKSPKEKAKKEPGSADMHDLVALYSQGHYADTEAAARSLIEKFPVYGFGWKVLGAALQQQARPDEAMQAMKKAVALLPNDAEAHGNLGNSFKEHGLLADAIASYQRALAIKPDYSEAHYNLGNTFMEQGQLVAAEASLRQAITIKPDFAIAHNNLGNIFKEQGRYSDAQASYRRALEIKPDYAEAHNNLGATFKEQGRLSEAEASYQRAIEIKPNYASAHYNLGNTFKDQRKHTEAENCYRRALEIQPDYAETHSNLGVILMQQGRYSEAEFTLMRALEIKPDYAEAHINLGSTFLEQGRLTESQNSYRHAQRLQPEALQHALHAYLMLPIIHDSVDAMMFWRERYQNGIHALMSTPGSLEEPGKTANSLSFYLAYHNANDRPLMQALHQFFRARVAGLTTTAPHIQDWQTPATTGRCIRVGFLSEFLVAHTIGKLYQGFIRHLDRSRFEVVIIHAPNAKQDSFRQSLDAIADKVLTLPTKLKDQQQAVAAEQLDVLFFPDIGMTPTTYFLAYARLAPVQAVSWGHPDTTGLDTMDYFVSAAAIEPDDAETHYSERLIRLNRLPCFYQPAMTVTELPSRAALGLPESGTLYGCPQTLFKIHPDFDGILAAIAEGDPTGHIVLLAGEKPVQCEQLRARWSKNFPILLDRVLFLPRMPLERFMALMAHIDVLLDPVHFGSGNTLYEGMVYGTPVVTYPGQFMRGRIVAGAYWQMGIDDAPIATRLEDYASLALALGRDPERRRVLRQASIEAAKQKLFGDMLAVREFECFLTAAVTATGRGEKLPVGWHPDIHKNHNQGVCA